MHFLMFLHSQMIIIHSTMQQLTKPHSHTTTFQFDQNKLQATLCNADRNINYVLLTNSVILNIADESIREQTCQECKQKLYHIVYTIKSTDISKNVMASQLQGIKCCVLPFKDTQCRLQQSLGDKSAMSQKKSAIITNNLVIGSDKAIKSDQYDRQLYTTAASRASKAQESLQDIPNEDLLSSVVFSLQKEQEVIEHYEIFVTKLQKEVGESYRSGMFYEYAWTEAEIQHIMHKIDIYFGPIHSFIPRRRYLCFTFAKNKHDCLFKNKYEAIGRQTIFRNNVKLEGGILNYYLVSRNQLLPNEQQTGKLFLLPNNQSITDMQIVSQWIIIAAESYIMFVHSQRPMEYFHHEQKIYPTKLLSHLNSNNTVLAADKRGFIYCFSLQQTKIAVQSKFCVSYLTPYSLVHLQNGIGIAGIDIEPSKKITHCSIFMVKLEGKPQQNNKPLQIEARLEVITIQGQNMTPINNLIATKEKDVVACTWSNKFFLVSLQGFKLIEVQLKSTITKTFAVPFLFNHLNFVLLLKNGELVRVGVQCYGQGLGAQLSQIKANQLMDCIMVNNEGSKFELYGCEGRKINRISYLNDNRQRFLYEQSGKVVKMATSKEGMAYLLDLDHSIELKFLQI